MSKPESAKNVEKLFESFPHGTLAFMATGCGVIAVATLGLEVWTGRVHAAALGVPFVFVSAPLGVATAVLGGLMARVKWTWALPALSFSVAYWTIFVIWMIR